MKKVIPAIVAISLVIFSGCGQKTEETDATAILEEPDKTSEVGIDSATFNTIIGSIPSPLEISVLLKQSGTKYDASLLNVYFQCRKI